MRTMGIAVVIGVLAAGTAFAKITSTERDRLRAAGDVLKSLHATPDKDIPESLWNSASCVVVIPSVKKAAFIFGGEYGKGVATCRTSGGWTAPAFMQIEKGSWGAQIGANETDLVLLVMNQDGMKKLLQDNVSLGADASVAAGPVGRSASASTDLQVKAEILSYSRSNGVFAGIDLSGGKLGPDTDANHDVYGSGTDARQILANNAVTAPPAATPFLAAVRNEFTPAAAN